MKEAPAPTKTQGASEENREKSTVTAHFVGTSNPRYLRILAALLARARSREEVDRIAGASNGPDAIAALRALGLPMDECLPCDRTPCYDRDGQEVLRGIYWLTPAGRQRVQAWLRKRDAARERR